MKRDTKRLIWMHKDDQVYNLRKDEDPPVKAYSIPIQQICEGDFIEVSITLLSMQGLVNIKSIRWSKPLMSKTPTSSVLNYNKDLMIGPETNRA